MTKKQSNSKKILIIMLIAPVVILATALAITNNTDLRIESSKPKIKYPVSAVPIKPSNIGKSRLLLEPASGSPISNNILSIDVYEDSLEEGVVSVDLGLNFDSTKLEFMNIENTNSKFTQIPNTSATKDKVLITGFVNPPETLTGKQFIAKVNFKVLKSSGDTTISFVKEAQNIASPKSAIYSSKDGSNIWNQITTGYTYKLR